jgi:AraC-like DNA-binding protein
MRELWAHGACELEQRLAEAPSDAARVAQADAFLLRRLARSTRDPQLSLRAAQLLSASYGQLTIERLATSHGLSYRRLERAFARDVGLSPKHFARVVRVQRALELSTVQRGTTLAQLAADSGYADQAHFSREFSRLIGVSPGLFFAARFAVFETMAKSGSVGPRAEDTALSKTFKTRERARNMQRS